jgi:hypothetical protein
MSGSPEIEALDSGKIDVSGGFDYQMYCAIPGDSTIWEVSLKIDMLKIYKDSKYNLHFPQFSVCGEKCLLLSK